MDGEKIVEQSRHNPGSVQDNPRVVHEKVIGAFLAGRSRRVSAHSTDGQNLWLHGNLIAKKQVDGTIWISDAGWQTVTTKAALNALLDLAREQGYMGGRIYQEKGEWFITPGYQFDKPPLEWTGAAVVSQTGITPVAANPSIMYTTPVSGKLRTIHTGQKVYVRPSRRAGETSLVAHGRFPDDTWEGMEGADLVTISAHRDNPPVNLAWDRATGQQRRAMLEIVGVDYDMARLFQQNAWSDLHPKTQAMLRARWVANNPLTKKERNALLRRADRLAARSDEYLLSPYPEFREAGLEAAAESREAEYLAIHQDLSKVRNPLQYAGGAGEAALARRFNCKRNPLRRPEAAKIRAAIKHHVKSARNLARAGDVEGTTGETDILTGIHHTLTSLEGGLARQVEKTVVRAMETVGSFIDRARAKARKQIRKRNPAKRKSKGKYIRERVASPKKFAKGSLRTITRGGKKIVVGCPKGKYDAKRKRCKVGMRAQSILHPMKKKYAGKKNPKEKDLDYVVFGWSRDPKIGRAQLAGADGTLRFKKRADAIRLAKQQLKGVYDRTWVESVIYHARTGWTAYDIVFDERKSGNPKKKSKYTVGRGTTEVALTLAEAKKMMKANPQQWKLYKIYSGKKMLGKVISTSKGEAVKIARKQLGAGTYEAQVEKHYGSAYRAGKAPRRNARKNPILQTVSLVNPGKRKARKNPPGDVVDIPFKNGERIPLAKAQAWIERNGTPGLKRQFREALQLQTEANRKPQFVIWQTLPIGDPHELEMVTAMAQYGTTDETLYTPPKGSKKGRHLYRHEWGDGSGKRKPVPILAASSGKAMVTLMGQGQSVGDWMRG